jgi:hypothetical protein
VSEFRLVPTPSLQLRPFNSFNSLLPLPGSADEEFLQELSAN